MEDFLFKCNELASEIGKRVGDVRKSLGQTPVPPALIEAFENFKKAVETYERAAEADDVNKIASAGKMVAVHGQSVARSVQGANDAQLWKGAA